MYFNLAKNIRAVCDGLSSLITGIIFFYSVKKLKVEEVEIKEGLEVS